jgi:hypothetical protein
MEANVSFSDRKCLLHDSVAVGKANEIDCHDRDAPARRSADVTLMAAIRQGRSDVLGQSNLKVDAA